MYDVNEHWTITYPTGKKYKFRAVHKHSDDASRYVSERIPEGGDGVYTVERDFPPLGEGWVSEYTYRVIVQNGKVTEEKSL